MATTDEILDTTEGTTEEIELEDFLKDSHPIELEFPAEDFPKKDYPLISGQTFRLDYDRQSAMELERQGFKVTDLDITTMDEAPLKSVLPVFYGSFRKHQPRIAQEVVDEVFDTLGMDTAQTVYGEMYKRLMLVYMSLQEGMVDSRPKPKARLRLV